MSTEFNPATFEHEGVVYEAKEQTSEHWTCRPTCAFYIPLKLCLLADPCHWPDRPDGKNIIWVVRAQKGKKP